MNKEELNKQISDYHDLAIKRGYASVEDGLTEGELINYRHCEIDLRDIILKEAFIGEGKKRERSKKAKQVNRRWKRQEDWFCKRAGLKREGHMRRGVSCPDGVSDVFSVDITGTENKLAFLNNEMRDAEAHTTQSRISTLVIFQEDKELMDGFVIHRVRDWLNLHGV